MKLETVSVGRVSLAQTVISVQLDIGIILIVNLVLVHLLAQLEVNMLFLLN